MGTFRFKASTITKEVLDRADAFGHSKGLRYLDTIEAAQEIVAAPHMFTDDRVNIAKKVILAASIGNDWEVAMYFYRV